MSTHQANSGGPVASTQQIPWDDLRLLLAVVRTQSVRGAATILGLNPSTISRRLAGLESALGTQLFERHPTGLKLTRAGEEASQFGTQLEDQLRELQIRLASQNQQLAGNLRVTCAEVISALCCQLLAAFLRAQPGIQLELTVSDAMLSVERHEVDLAVRVADAPPENLVGQRVGKSAVGLFASSDYVEEYGRNLGATHHRFVEWPSALSHKPAFRWLDERFPRRLIAARANSASAVLSGARAGLGIAPLGLTQVAGTRDLILLEPLPEDCATGVWLLTHPELRKTARVRAALDFLGTAFRASPGILS